MAKRTLSPLQRQVARVNRRLFLQTLLNCLVWCWTGALILTAAWFLLQPYLLEAPPPWLRGTVAGSLLAAGAVLAVVLALVRSPSRLIAALSIDERFGLKERVTTSLTLAPEMVSTPAGQALLQDVNQRVDKLDVPSRFPVRVSWTAALLPVCAGLLACVAFFHEPQKGQATSTNQQETAQAALNKDQIDQKMKDLRKKTEQRAPAKPKSDEIEKLEAELEKIANKPHDTKDELRERIKEMTALEETMKNREKEMADKSKSLKQQLQQLDKMSQKGQDGPARELQKALSEGKFDKAAEEIDRLMKKMQEHQMDAKDREKLQQQLQDIQKKLERLAQQKDREEKLKAANLDPETLKREMKRLAEDKKKLEDLQNLANKLGQAQQKLKDGNPDEAAEALKDASNALKNMGLDDQSLEDLREQLARLTDAKDSC